MAKNKAKKIPKRIAGVKLPKALRRGLRDLAASQSGKTVLAEALSAAAAVLAATQAQPGSTTRKLAAQEGPRLNEATEALRATAGEARAAAVAALEEAARSFTAALRGRGSSDGVAAAVPPTSSSTH